MRIDRGDRGDKVRRIQLRLNELGYYHGRISSYFGPVTEAAVRRFQRSRNLVVDGWVGPQTWGSLFPTEARPPKPTHYNISVFDMSVGADVTQNPEIRNNIKLNEIIERQKQGSTLIQFGNGNVNKLLIWAGIHGNEEEANIATMMYIDWLKNRPFNGTIYIIPFAIPASTARNSRNFMMQPGNLDRDPNRVAHIQGTPGWRAVEFARNNGVRYILDVHSGGGLERARNGLIIATTNRAAEREWARYIQRKIGSEISLGSGIRGMLRNQGHRHNINTILIEVERDRGCTAEWARLTYRMIEAAVEYLFPDLR